MIHYPEIEPLMQYRFGDYANEATRLGLPPWPAESPHYDKTSDHTVGPLYVLTRVWRPRIVVETGVEGGRSSWAILAAMTANQGGTLWSLDPCETPFAWNNSPLAQWGHIRKTSQEGLPDLLDKRLTPGSVDIFIHDSDHEEPCQTFEYEQAWNHVRPGGLICSDDWSWSNHHAWERFCQRHARGFTRVGAIAVLVR